MPFGSKFSERNFEEFVDAWTEGENAEYDDGHSTD